MESKYRGLRTGSLSKQVPSVESITKFVICQPMSTPFEKQKLCIDNFELQMLELHQFELQMCLLQIFNFRGKMLTFKNFELINLFSC